MLHGEEAPVLSSYVIFRGVSGAEYSYMPLARAPLLKGRSGNYVVARPADRGWAIVAAGEGADLGTGPWASPVADETVFIRFNVSRAAREAELADIVQPVGGAEAGLRATG